MSGGPTPVINATFAEIIETARSQVTVLGLYGMRGGIRGLIDDDVCCLYDDGFSEINTCLPGAILGTCRHKMMRADESKILDNLKKHSINCVLLIGGNDTMDTASRLNDLVIREGYDCSVIGVPKTIDNDLYIDHSPGYISAAKYVSRSVARIIYDHKSFNEGGITIIETMGRNAGWLTAAAYLTEKEILGVSPDFIYLPEKSFSLKRAVSEIKNVYDTNGYCAVVISEGVRDEFGREVGAGLKVDGFGHAQLGGVSDILKNEILAQYPKLKVRVERLGTMQRACDPDPLDLYEAKKIGQAAVAAAVAGYSGIMVTMTDNWPKLHEVANRERVIPEAWINDSEQLIEYLKATIYPD